MTRIHRDISTYTRNSSVTALLALLEAEQHEYISPRTLNEVAELVAQRIIVHAQFDVDHLWFNYPVSLDAQDL